MYLSSKEAENWKQINFRNIDFMLSVQFIYDLYDQYDANINWFRFKNVCLYYRDDKLWSFTPQDDWEAVLTNIAQQFCFPQKYDSDIIENCYNYCKRDKKKLHNRLQKIAKTNLTKLSQKELYEELFNWYQTTLNQIYFINLAPVEHGLQRAISSLNVDKLLTIDEISILYSLDGNTAVMEEEYAFLKAIFQQNKQKTKTLLKKHLKNYEHITLGYGSKQLDEDMLLERYHKIIALGENFINKRMNEIELYPKTIKMKKEQIIKKINNQQIIELFDLAAQLGLLRDKNKALLGKAVQFRNKLINEIARRMSLSDEILKYYIMEDFYNLLILDKKLSLSEIKKRQKGVYIEAVTTMAVSAEARENYYHSVKPIKEDVSVLASRRGICASPGKVKGKAKICLTFAESNKLKEGEILITYGTDFDFMNAIVKSSAIVTEEGGILSHASVISRELNKPCVIAFKGITQLIKDGDTVEIDASQGIVRLLSSKQKEEKINRIKDVYHISEKTKISEIGSKAAKLSELYNLEYNVPKAYFFSVSYFQNLLKKQNKFDEYMKYISNLDYYEDDIYALIDSLEIPQNHLKQILSFKENTYAVRSSSLNEDGEKMSFAGQYVTELFCDSLDFTAEGMKTCWKSLLGMGLENYSDFKKQLNVFGGIIIQEMVNADYAGVMFTKDPVDNNPDIIVIESCQGVAAKLVDNQVVADRYLIEKNSLKILSKPTHNKISKKMILAIAKMGIELEKHYGYAVDIEWACEKNKLFLLQCRPITT